MKRPADRLLPLLLAAALCIHVCAASAAQSAAGYLCAAVPSPQVGAVGGEWAVLAVSRAGYAAPDGYFDRYRTAAAERLRLSGGVLSPRRHTEYSRVILALSALGTDARSFAGYDLTLPLGDYEKTVAQGLNGAAFALLALDSAAYPMPRSGAGVPATRQMYAGLLLARQNADGGWSLSGDSSDADLTAMALQALAPYRAQPRVDAAVARGVACLSALQNADGSFPSDSVPTAESCAQALLALCALAIPVTDARFVKGGATALDALLRFAAPAGGFRHTADGAVNPMASEQAACALAALERAAEGRPFFYDMRDALTLRAEPVTFSDIRADRDRASIETLAALGAVNGKGNGRYDPSSGLTRAEFAAIVTRAFGLVPGVDAAFFDVAADAWYAPYVGAAYRSGVVNGVGGGRFAPDGTLSRQEAAVMLTRAAAFCALDTAADEAALSARLDASSVASWARAGVAYCIGAEIWRFDGLLDPERPVTRGEMAQMVCALLARAAIVTEAG